jgi:transcriptional regulator with XRE-family HTH domain
VIFVEVKDFDLDVIGKRIRHILIDQEETLTQLATNIGTSRQGLYSKIANNTWTVADIYKVADALKIDPAELIRRPTDLI